MPERERNRSPLDTLDPSWDRDRIHAHLGRFTGYRPPTKRVFTNFGASVWSVEHVGDEVRIVPRTSPTLANFMVLAVLHLFAAAGAVWIWMYMPLAGKLIGSAAILLGLAGGWVQLASVTWMKKGQPPLAVVHRNSGTLAARPPVGTRLVEDVIRVETVRVSYRAPSVTYIEPHIVLCIRGDKNPAAVHWIPLDPSSSSAKDRAARTLAEAMRVPLQETTSTLALDW